MSDGLTDALRVALAWAKNGNDPRLASTFRSDEYSEHLRRIETEVSAHAVLGSLDGKLVRSGGAAASISNRLVAHALFERAYELDDVDAAIDRTVSFVQAPAFDVLTVVTLFGVRTDRTIPLSDNLSFTTPSELPRSANFQRLFPLESEKFAQRVFAPGTVFATSALTYRWRIENGILPATFDSLTGAYDQTEDRDVERAIACLVLSSNESVQRIHRYHENLHQGHLWPGSGWSEHPTTTTFRDPVVVDETNLTELFKLTGSFADWSEFYRLVRRLNNARAKQDLVDAHIDLGIVAECALTKGDGKDTEISQRLRTRIAWLLGTDPKTRRATAKAMNELYTRRSTAVHSGEVSNKKRETFLQDDDLCRRLLIAILRRGHFPQSKDWSDIVYG